jgi:signal transduction histidine kinase/CheY-like chemotaxis protein
MAKKPTHEPSIRARELAADARESAADSRELELGSREQAACLRDDALRQRAEADELRADRERLLLEMREANEKLVLATVRADELADEAEAARATLSASAEALRESEARYRTLFRSIDEGFCVFEVLYDRDGAPADLLYVETNPAFENQTGLRDAPGKRALELMPELEAHWFQTYGDVVATGRPARFVNEAKPLGRWFDVYAFRIGGVGTSKCACLFTDITERRRVDAQLRASSRAKDEFLAMLGHELRNPLAPILTALDLMAMRDPSASRREREVIGRQMNHLVHLVDDLLDVSRITSGKVELRREPIELADVVTRAVETASPLFERKSHELIVNVASHGLAVDGDATRLTQVVANLLTNAAKYTPARGTIAVTGERRGSSVVLGVRDSGIGISEDMLPRVFDLFVQERQAIDRAPGGLGLGLAIVKSLVAMHGGTSTARSEGVGRGSEFEIELPASTTHAQARGDEVRRSEPGPGDLIPRVARAAALRKILVVDDNRDAAGLMAELLTVRGYEVRVAFDGPSAVAIVEDFIPDVALLDIGLPVMDGYELATQLRTLLVPYEIRFIAITGYGQAVDRSRSRDAGFVAHLIKPVDIEVLQASLDRALAGSFAEPGLR